MFETKLTKMLNSKILFLTFTSLVAPVVEDLLVALLALVTVRICR